MSLAVAVPESKMMVLVSFATYLLQTLGPLE